MALEIQHAHPTAPHLQGGPSELACLGCGARFEASRFSLEDAPDEAERFVAQHVEHRTT